MLMKQCIRTNVRKTAFPLSQASLIYIAQYHTFASRGFLCNLQCHLKFTTLILLCNFETILHNNNLPAYSCFNWACVLFVCYSVLFGSVISLFNKHFYSVSFFIELYPRHLVQESVYYYALLCMGLVQLVQQKLIINKIRLPLRGRIVSQSRP